MKKFSVSIYLLALVFAFVSCDDFLTYEPSNAVNDVTAFKTAKDVENGLNGVY